MSRRVPRIKGIHDNSQIKAIGNIYRPIEGKDWKINLQLEPEQGKQALKISKLPLLARRRVLNATEPSPLSGYKLECVIGDGHWEEVKVGDCPLPGLAQRQDREQWCFRFKQDGVQFYLPQLELARVLFLYEPYLCRMAMHPGGLAEEFDIQLLEDPDSIQINLLPSTNLPKHVRSDHELRRALALVVLDPDMRRSFESISKYQVENGEDLDQYRVWQFRFDPPPLNQVHLTVRGHYDPKIATMFVYEVYGLEGVESNHPHNIHFFDPEFEHQIPGKGTAKPVQAINLPEVEIDDDELPVATGIQELVLESPQVVRSYRNPAHTTRSGKDKKRLAGGRKEDDLDEDQNDEIGSVGIDESSNSGQVMPGGIDGVDDQSDDAKNYAGRFQAFDAMVKVLVESKGCKKISSMHRQLPKNAGHSKPLLVDGNPRCWSIQILSFGYSRFALMEVDTQENRSRLSTLLVKQPEDNFDWKSVISELGTRVVRNSLQWPTKYLDSIFPSDHLQRISHPRTSSDNKDLLETESILHWADRVLNKMQ